MAKVKTGLYGLKPSDLAAFASRIETKMSGNPVFPDPTPTIAELTAAREELEARINAASDGGRTLISKRRAQEKVVTEMIQKLASYVQLMSQDETDILSSGFDVRRRPSPITELPRPDALQALRNAKEGVVELQWKPVRGSSQYLIEIRSDDTPVWDIADYSTRSRCLVPNLIPGKVYWFRVRAQGSVGNSPFSDPATVMAA